MKTKPKPYAAQLAVAEILLLVRRKGGGDDRRTSAWAERPHTIHSILSRLGAAPPFTSN